MFLLPKDLNKAIEDMCVSAESSLTETNSRYTIQYKFEGIKLNNIGFRLYDALSSKRKVFITFSDMGSVALAKRDKPEIKDVFFTFKSFTDSKYIEKEDSVLISIQPQPYDFDSFEPMADKFKGTHYSINPKFEDANIGIGSVIRERRKNFINTWTNIYHIQPLDKGALMHVYPSNWSLFRKQNDLYSFVKDYEKKPDNETIFVDL